MAGNLQRNSIKAAASYATEDDFNQLFTAEIDDLFRLSFQLTADVTKAEQCLVLAMKDCSGARTIFGDFARVWARRMVIRNAIHLIPSADSNSACVVQSSELHNENHLKMAPVLDLPEFDRLAFVICALEHLSIKDCALLLRKSPKDVNEAIARAENQLASRESRRRSSFDTSDSRHSLRRTVTTPPFILHGLAS